jgi:mono/diheme cytochrome c family protein
MNPGRLNPAGRQRRFARAAWAALLSFLVAGMLDGTAGTGWAQGRPKVDFAHEIAPLLEAHCVRCHTNGTYKGGFSLETRAAMLRSEAVVPGKSLASELIDRLTSDEDDYRMPPKGERLTGAEVARVKAWIDQGVGWEDGFTFKTGGYVPPLKPRRPTLPPPRGDRTHPIDRIIDAYLAEQKVSPPRPLDDTAYLRRVSLDVIGRLPEPRDLEAFLADTDPEKRVRLVRRLLADRRGYAIHWLTFWNDLLRNDYRGTGFTDGGRKQITGWLYQALLENRPYDRFVSELISPAPESEGFIYGIKWRGRVNASQTTEVQFAQNVSQVFFGINMKCASCHDSFIDRWKLEEAYGLAAVIADGSLEIYRCDKATGKHATPRFLWPELGTIDADRPKPERLEQLARLVTHPENGRFARTIVNRIWHRLMGRGIVHPVDVMANEPWSEDLLDDLAADFAAHGSDLKWLLERIVTSQAYQSAAVPRDETETAAADDYVFEGPEIKRMTAEQFLDAVWMITGTAPTKGGVNLRPESVALGGAPNEPFLRAALVNSDLLMRSLGRPNREQVVTTRGETLTTLQALDLSNGQILAETLSRGAARLIAADPDLPAEERVDRLFLQALCRRPTADERATARDLLGTPATAEGLADLLWAVFMLPEFQLIR